MKVIEMYVHIEIYHFLVDHPVPKFLNLEFESLAEDAEY
jgi:hypothetical protein